MAVNIKQIKEECDEMSAGLAQAPEVEFNGIKKSDFDAKRIAARALEDEIAVDEAALKSKKDRRDTMYKELSADRVKISKGIAGHKDYGEDSELYGACGFVRKSERRSGLTRGKKANDDDSEE